MLPRLLGVCSVAALGLTGTQVLPCLEVLRQGAYQVRSFLLSERESSELYAKEQLC